MQTWWWRAGRPLAAGISLLVWAGTLSGSMAATVTCEGNDPQKRCCESWIIDVTRAGEHTGILWEDTYEKLMRRLSNAQAIDKRLCAYWKDESCTTQYGPPKCHASAFAPSGPARNPRLTPEAERVVLNNARQLVDGWKDKVYEAIRDLAIAVASRDQFRLPGVGGVYAEYDQVLDHAQATLARLEQQLHEIIGTPGFEVVRTLDELSRELRQTVARAGHIYDRLPPNAKTALGANRLHPSSAPPAATRHETTRHELSRSSATPLVPASPTVSADGTCDGYRLLPGERCCRDKDDKDITMVCTSGSLCPPPNMVCE